MSQYEDRLAQTYGDLVWQAINSFNLNRQDGDFFYNKLYTNQNFTSMINAHSYNGQLNIDSLYRELQEYIHNHLQGSAIPNRPYQYQQQYNLPPARSFQQQQGTVVPEKNSLLGAWDRNRRENIRNEQPEPVVQSAVVPQPTKPATFVMSVASPAVTVKPISLPEKCLSIPFASCLLVNSAEAGKDDMAYIHLDTVLPVKDHLELWTILRLNYPELFVTPLWCVTLDYLELHHHQFPTNIGQQGAVSYQKLKQKAQSIQSITAFKTSFVAAMANEVMDGGYWSKFLMDRFNDLCRQYFKASCNPFNVMTIDNWDDLDVIVDKTNSIMAERAKDFDDLSDPVWVILQSALHLVFSCGDLIEINEKNIGLFSSIPSMQLMKEGYLLKDYFSMSENARKEILKELNASFILHTSLKRCTFTNVPVKDLVGTHQNVVVKHNCHQHPIHWFISNTHSTSIANISKNIFPALVKWNIFNWNMVKNECEWEASIGATIDAMCLSTKR